MHTTTTIPTTPHATAWHGGMGGAQAGRGGMHPVFHLGPPPSPLFPPFFFSPWLLGAHATPLLSLFLPPLVSSPCLVSPQSYCSVCHCMVVILTTRPHGVLLFPLSLSSFPLPTHQQAALGCDASPTWRAGMLAAPPEEDLVTKEHTALPPTPPPFLMFMRTRRCSCCALPEDTTTTTTTARHTSSLVCRHRGHSQCQPSRRWARQQGVLLSLSLFCCSAATNGPVSSTCKAEDCNATRHNSTRAWRTGCACSQAHTFVCEPATWLPTSIWLQAATAAATETSRPRCPLGGGTPSM